MSSESTIYEDVLQLQEQMAEVQATIANLTTRELVADEDLNDLGVGTYVIPNTTVCGTLLNKPTTSNATAFIRVTAGGISGQLLMDYIPCANDPTYYHREYYSGTWHEWHTVALFDSGWITLPLLNNVLAHSSDQAPQYRKIGKHITVRGVMKNITTFPTTIAQLPEGFRPSRRIIDYIISNGVTIARLEVETNGNMNVTYHGANNAGTVSASTHYSFGTFEFLID